MRLVVTALEGSLVLVGVRGYRAELSVEDVSFLLWAVSVVACSIAGVMFWLAERKDRREIATGLAWGVGLVVLLGALVGARAVLVGG